MAFISSMLPPLPLGTPECYAGYKVLAAFVRETNAARFIQDHQHLFYPLHVESSVTGFYLVCED